MTPNDPTTNLEVGSTQWLERLWTTANAAIDEAKKLYAIEGEESRFSTDSVNWSRVSCWNASWCRDMAGNEGAVVEIANAASPDGAPQLCNWVVERLDQLGFPGVVARTQW